MQRAGLKAGAKYIPPNVEAFIERERRDFRQCLTWQQEDIERAIAKLPIRPPLFEGLRRSQQICVAIGASLRKFAFYNDMGTGKTLIAMALAAYFDEVEGGVGRFIVLVPNRVNIRGWLDQVNKHAPHLKAVAMPSNMAEKREVLEQTDALLIIETYAGFSRLCSKPSGKKLVIDKGMIGAVAHTVSGLILDESSAIGNHRSLQTEVISAIAEEDGELCMFLLSGTPFGRDPHLLWPQMKLLDNGYTLGSTLGQFRHVFFRTKQNPWGGFEHEFITKQTPLLNRCIAHRSIRFALDEADLPAVNPIVVSLDLPREALRYHEAAITTLRKAQGNFDLCKNAFMRLRQISSGFINMKDADTGEKDRLVFKENPKLDWVVSQIEGMDGQIIVFHDFIHSGEVLKKALDKLEVTNATINGRVSGAAVNKAYDDFTQGKVQVLLLNSAAGAYGVNLQMARYGIYYESPVPVITRKQTELRFIRPGSEHQRVVKIDLVMNNTVDRAILAFHDQGEDLFQAILNGDFKL